MKLIAKREWGPHHDQLQAATYNGRWVVRDEMQTFIDVDQYRNDLLGRYPGLIIIEED